jgi:hypothetical protein
MQNLLKGFLAWRSTMVVLFFMALLGAGVWFEKLDTEALLGLAPLVMALFKDWFKEKTCKNE